MKEYELALLVSGNLNEATAKEALDKAEKLIAENKGAVIKTEDWGRRKLAYKIKGNEFGYYRFVRVKLEPTDTAKLVESLRLLPEILRVMLVDAKSIPEKKKVEEKTSTEKAQETAKEKKKEKKERPQTEKQKKLAEKAKKKLKISEEEEEKKRMAELEKKLGEILKE